MPLNLGEQFRRIDPALHRPVAGGKHLLQGLPLGAFQPQHIRRDKAAAPRNGVDNALALQLLIGLGDGVGVDADLAGQRPHRGQLLILVQHAQQRQPQNLLLQLLIDRRAALQIYLDHGFTSGGDWILCINCISLNSTLTAYQPPPLLSRVKSNFFPA